MRKIILLAAAPLLLLSGVAISTSVGATEVRAAVKMCDANPNCGYGSPGSDGSMTLSVGDGKGGPTRVIHCPPKGDCQVVASKKGGKGKSATNPRNVNSALANRTNSTDPKSTRRPGTTPTNLNGGQTAQPRGDGRVQTPTRQTGIVRDHRADRDDRGSRGSRKNK